MPSLVFLRRRGRATALFSFRGGRGRARRGRIVHAHAPDLVGSRSGGGQVEVRLRVDDGRPDLLAPRAVQARRDAGHVVRVARGRGDDALDARAARDLFWCLFIGGLEAAGGRSWVGVCGGVGEGTMEKRESRRGALGAGAAAAAVCLEAPRSATPPPSSTAPPQSGPRQSRPRCTRSFPAR